MHSFDHRHLFAGAATGAHASYDPPGVPGKRTLTEAIAFDHGHAPPALPRLDLVPVQRKVSTAPATPTDADAADDGHAAAAHDSGGSPLDEAVRASMEASFAADFSTVRVHEDAAATGAMGAVAFARGEHVHFAPGAYRPGSTEGRELIGHELAHVVQQRAGRVAVPQGKASPINADPALEAEADALGARAARGLPAAIAGGTAAPAGSLAIQAKAEGSKKQDRRNKAEELKGTAAYKKLSAVDRRYARYLLSDDCTTQVIGTTKQLTAAVKDGRTTAPKPYVKCFLAVEEIDEWFEAKHCKDEDGLQRAAARHKKLAGPLSKRERQSLRHVRQVGSSQPAGTKPRPREDEPLWMHTAPERWRESASKGPTPARMATHDNQVASGIGDFCISCHSQIDLKYLQNDHQIAFANMRMRLVQLAQLLSRLPTAPKDEQTPELVRVAGKNWKRMFTRDADGVVVPTQAALLDYSNDLGNLLLICPTCNGFAAKSDIDVQAWFRDQPMFGDPFLRQFAGAQEFFGNPTDSMGWGTAAREWCEGKAKFFVGVMHMLEAAKRKSRELGAELLEEEARIGDLPEKTTKQKLTKQTSHKHLKRRRSGYEMGANVASKVLTDPGDEPEYDVSDEEEEADRRYQHVATSQSQRTQRAARRSASKPARQKALLGKPVSEPVGDTPERRPWLANVGYSQALGIPPELGPLVDRNEPDALELVFVDEQRDAFARFVKQLQIDAYDSGLAHQAPPDIDDPRFELHANNQAALLQRVLKRYGEGVVAAAAPAPKKLSNSQPPSKKAKTTPAAAPTKPPAKKKTK